MMEWQISDQDIQAAEELLLPHGAHFPEDARNVIRCWHSTDVAACPGSGKTTVLLAKLKLLADRMPLENGAGICVLSHTNVAVNEIKNRLSDYADRLLSYPNYIGTIQSFIDRFVTMPYLRNVSGQNVQVVDIRLRRGCAWETPNLLWANTRKRLPRLLPGSAIARTTKMARPTSSGDITAQTVRR